MSAPDVETLSREPINSAQFKSALMRVSSEVKRRSTGAEQPASYDYFAAVTKALAQLKGSAQLPLRMGTVHDCVSFFFLNGRVSDALSASALLLRMANASSDQEWQRRSFHLRGMVLAESGRIADAVIAYANALELARNFDDPLREARTLINLGAAFNFGSLYKEALPCLESAVQKTANLVQSGEHRAALSNLAETHYFLGAYDRAYQLIVSAVEGHTAPGDAFAASGLAVRQFIAVKISLERGDIAAARRHCKLCQAHAKASGASRSVFIAYVAAGLIEIYDGDVDAGLALLTKALRDSKGVPGYEECLAALVRAYDRAGEPELALEHMDMRLDHLSRLRKELVSLVTAGADESELFNLHLAASRLRTKVAQNNAVRSQTEMFERLAVTADLKEEASGEHGYRVGRLSALMAEDLGWTKEACRAIDMAARLHDIGKIAMPDRILLTSEQLKEAERHIMSTHTLVGAELLAKSNIPQLQMAEEIAKFHHEWWNGEGYPAKRREKRIPIHARIVALADVFDALTHGRPFAEPWPIDKALDEIRNRRGTQFDPELTDLFLALVARLRREHQDLDDYLGKAGRNSPFLQARQKIRLMLADPPTAAAPKAARETVH